MKKNPKVALFGVSHQALHIARACALRDNPVVGVYDSDLEIALKGALFLGTSAQPNFELLMKLEPDVLICSAAPPEAPDGVLLIQLCDQAGIEGANTCWAASGEGLKLGLPLKITSELPEIALTLEGPGEVVERAAAFLTSASAKISLRS